MNSAHRARKALQFVILGLFVPAAVLFLMAGETSAALAITFAPCILPGAIWSVAGLLGSG